MVRRGEIDLLGMGRVSLQGLTIGERLLIERRRRKFTQEQVASIYGISRNLYGQIERDQIDISAAWRHPIPLPKITELTKIEAAFLIRRRYGKTQEEVSDVLGISRYWLNRKECGEAPNDDLMDHWNL